MSELEKKVMAAFEKAVEEHKIPEFKLGYILCMCEHNAEGQKCQQ